MAYHKHHHYHHNCHHNHQHYPSEVCQDKKNHAYCRHADAREDHFSEVLTAGLAGGIVGGLLVSIIGEIVVLFR